MKYPNRWILRRIARRFAIVAVLLPCVLLLVSCGGGNGPGGSGTPLSPPDISGRTATAVFAIEFPATKATRVIPDQTRSIVLTVTGEGLDRAYTHTVARPAEQTVVEVPMLLPIGTKTLKAEARSQASGAGAVLASGSVTFELLPDEVKQVVLTMKPPANRWRFRNFLTDRASHTFHVQQTFPNQLDAVITGTVEIIDLPTEIEESVPFTVTTRHRGTFQVNVNSASEVSWASAYTEGIVGNPAEKVEKDFGIVRAGQTKPFDVSVQSTEVIQPSIGGVDRPVVGFIVRGSAFFLPSGNSSGGEVVAEYEKIP